MGLITNKSERVLAAEYDRRTAGGVEIPVEQKAERQERAIVKAQRGLDRIRGRGDRAGRYSHVTVPAAAGDLWCGGGCGRFRDNCGCEESQHG